MKDIIILAVFSGLSLNLLLQMGLGIRDTGSSQERFKLDTLIQWGMLFFAVLLFWLLFSYIFSPLALGYFECFFLFPMIKAAGKGLDALVRRFLPLGVFPAAWRPILERKNLPAAELFPVAASCDGLIMAALILTLRLACSLVEAAAISLGFSLGGAVAAFILRGIYKRSSLERLPRALRGRPLLFISMGLMSLIFSSTATILLRILENK
ncbi:MAG: hypothetical protein LBU18_03375 [Treponema sp.]|jgi:electron transport complex protein RnfA|nr:hypothetical protein [Treponema sp.]